LSTPQGGSIHTFAIDTGNGCTTLFVDRKNIILKKYIYFWNKTIIFNYFVESKDIHYLPITKPFHESVSVIDVCNDALVCYKSSLNKPGQLFAIKIPSVFEGYDFTNISIHEISPSRSLPNSNNFVVEHGYTLYSKIQITKLITNIYSKYLI